MSDQPWHEPHATNAGGVLPRERFRTAVERLPTGTISYDLGHGIASFTLDAHERMCQYLGVTPPPPTVTARPLQIVEPCTEINNCCAGDLRFAFPNGPVDPTAEAELPDDAYLDEWGIVRRRPPGGLYYDIVASPLSEASSWADCRKRLRLPRDAAVRAEGMRQQAEAHRENGYAVGAMCFAGIFEMVFWLRGYLNAYIDFGRRPAIAEGLMDTLLEVNVEFWRAILTETGGLLDVALLTEDLGTQRGLMISPRQLRSIVLPRIGALIGEIKALSPSTKVLLHSCGAIAPVIPDLIDIGVDILNPVQPGAAGMDPAALKRDFGDSISFHGGIDIQHVLPYGTPEEVREHVWQQIQALGAGGGYVVAPAHCVQPDVPPENVLALVHAVESFGDYPSSGQRGWA